MESRTTPGLPIAIIGGGLAGITCSIGLSRHGKVHKIYESASSFRGGMSASVVMGPNALAALKEIDPRLREYFDSCATRNQDDEKSNSWFSFRHGMEIAPASGANVVDGGTFGFGSMIADVQAFGPTESGRSCVHRGTLIEKMACLVPEGIAEFGKQLINLEDFDTAVKLTFEDGTVAWASAVLACDGIKSVVRRAMLQSDPASIEPAFAGEYCYPRLVPMLEAQRILGDEMATNGNIFCGYNGYVITYPVMIDNHKFVNMAAVRRQCDNTWPDADAWRQPCTTESMLQDFGGWGDPVIQLLKGIEKPEKWAIFDSRAAKTYANGRVCLLGDAAHASTPHQGAGAGMAFENACIINHLLRGARGSQDVVGAFQVFDKIRWGRTQYLVETSRAAGQVFSFAHEGIMDNIDSVRENLMVRHLWIWNFDIRRQLREAEARALLPILWEEHPNNVTTHEVLRSERQHFSSVAHSGRRATGFQNEEGTDEEDFELPLCSFVY